MLGTGKLQYVRYNQTRFYYNQGALCSKCLFGRTMAKLSYIFVCYDSGAKSYHAIIYNCIILPVLRLRKANLFCISSFTTNAQSERHLLEWIKTKFGKISRKPTQLKWKLWSIHRVPRIVALITVHVNTGMHAFVKECWFLWSSRFIKIHALIFF